MLPDCLIQVKKSQRLLELRRSWHTFSKLWHRDAENKWHGWILLEFQSSNKKWKEQVSKKHLGDGCVELISWNWRFLLKWICCWCWNKRSLQKRSQSNTSLLWVRCCPVTTQGKNTPACFWHLRLRLHLINAMTHFHSDEYLTALPFGSMFPLSRKWKRKCERENELTCPK